MSLKENLECKAKKIIAGRQIKGKAERQEKICELNNNEYKGAQPAMDIKLSSHGDLIEYN